MILLTCDHPKREIEDLENLKRILKTNSINCKIINKALIPKAYNLYKPKIITIPHTVPPMYVPINQIHKKTTTVLIPSESCIFVDKFIDMLYCNKFKNYTLKSNLEKVDYVFTQSEYTSKYLKNKKIINKKLISTGFLYYDYWYETKKKIKKNKKTIGIALTFNLPFRYYNNKEFILNYYSLSKDLNYKNTPWRLKELSLNLMCVSLIFEIIDKLSKKYFINIRPHPLDAQTAWQKIYKNNQNIKIDSTSKLSEWIQNQDMIISTFSAINIDTYVFKKPHISLVNMIPKEFFDFLAYNSHSYKDYKETRSFKPKNMNELEVIIRNIKFKKSKIMDLNLKKYYNFPSKSRPVEKVAENLIKIYHKEKIKNHQKIIYSSFQKKLNYIIGNYLSSLILYYLGEFKIYFNRYNNHNYFSPVTRFFLKIPYKIYRIFNK